MIRVLQADPELAAGLAPPSAEHALLLAVARSEWLPVGGWTPVVPEAERPGHLGLLVLEGLVARHASLLDRVCVELLGKGDLMRPWQPTQAVPFAAGASRWDVLVPTQVAILDRRFAAIAGRWPEIMAALTGRALRRSRDLTLGMAVSQLPKVDLRLLAVLWHVGLRWGRGEADGVVLPVRLTHDALGRMVSARRQTTTAAMSLLVERRLVTRRADGRMVLHGEPPGDLRALSRLLG